MRVVRREVNYTSRKDRFWKIIPFGDIHLGHINCHKDMVENTVNYIQENDNILWIGMGDYCDAISSKDRRYDPASIDPSYPTPDKQYRKMKEMFKPIADKCIGLLDGNHDRDHWKKHNHNYVDDLAYDLGIEYLDIDAYIRVIFKRGVAATEINMYAHHGWTSSRTAGGKVNNFHNMADIFPGLNVYLMGHTHDRGTAPPRTHLFVNKALDIVHHEMNFVHTGAYLRGYVDGNTGYVEEKNYKPAALGSPVINIEIDPAGNSTYNRPEFSFSTVPYNPNI